ncbi:MAG: serine/threonine protein kinase, partial [Elusimicrobia bacterium]|nr:serine/threonine protein kinase [Elusimicrobiota bacterium]
MGLESLTERIQMPKVYGGRWEIESSLDQGGQATIFLVKDLKKAIPDPSVLKRISNSKRRPRFVTEVKTCKKLAHKNIMKVIDHSALEAEGDDDEKMYLVMPHMKSGSLEKRAGLYKESMDSTLQVAAALADGLQHAHMNGVTHRDVKPANILFAEEDHVPTISDFGICLLRGEPRATDTGERVGPWAFMAPELEGGGQLDVTNSVDVYSLGKVIYFMLSGGVILPRERLSDPQYDLFKGRGGRYALLARLLDRMICVREKRIQTMSEVIKELQRIEDWEQKQEKALSRGASALLSGMLDDQRAALGIDEHNRLVEAEEKSRLETYTHLISDWTAQRLQDLTKALTQQDLSSARILTPKERDESNKACSRIALDGVRGGGQFADLEISWGLEFSLRSETFHRKHRLLLNTYSLRELRITLGGQRQKRAVVDHAILFAPYYFADEHWQAFFANKAAIAALARQPHRPRVLLGRNFVQRFDKQQALFHQTTIGTWPTDADKYQATIDAALEILALPGLAWVAGRSALRSARAQLARNRRPHGPAEPLGAKALSPNGMAAPVE